MRLIPGEYAKQVPHYYKTVIIRQSLTETFNVSL